jgi:competence ComEA-like helix-hairpin-helix protein
MIPALRIKTRTAPECGSLLIGLLWCLALLSLVVMAVLHTSRMDLNVVKNYGDRIQAHYLAVAGIEKAKALLYQDARERTRSARHHNGELFDAPEQFRDVALGRGYFRVFRRSREDEGGAILYGVSDEESRLNVNNASLEELSRVYLMTPDIAAAIVDWRDEDDVVTPGGAELEYYTSLQPPYQPRNGPLQTIRELLMVRGVTPSLLLGDDIHQNGTVEANGGEDQSAGAGGSDIGWAGMMTVDSSTANVTASGEERVNIQTADERSLTAVRGITTDIARAIIAYRGQNRFNSIADLLEVTAAQNQNQNQSGGRSTGNTSGQNQTPTDQGGSPNQSNQSNSGQKVISQDLLMDISDELTVQSGDETPGLLNLNSASLDVLACLSGISRELAQAIISFRQSNGFYPNIAWLLKVPGLSQDIFKQIAPRVTVRSDTFRILSEGRVNSTGARQRIQEIVHVGLREVVTVSYREDDL